MNQEPFLVPSGKKIALKDYDTEFTGRFSDKSEATEKLVKDVAALEELQDLLYAQGRTSLLIVLQAMDAAGKDSVVKHVMSGVNPQGVTVTSFKSPSSLELDHDFLWRHVLALPRRGMIGIFNRSYYEEALVVRVHPEFLANERLPKDETSGNIWKHRFEDINNFERYLSRNGTAVVKFFLHVSQKEQRKRFLARLQDPEKHWKFSSADLKERARWKEYMEAYEDVISNTSTEWAPWYVIPADHKWFTRAAVADILVQTMKDLKLSVPEVSEEKEKEFAEAARTLEAGE